MTQNKRISRTLRRKLAHKKPRERILIVCQGKETEPIYFKELKREKQISSLVVEKRSQREKREPIDIVNYV